jgi:hypothetical protein
VGAAAAVEAGEAEGLGEVPAAVARGVTAAGEGGGLARATPAAGPPPPATPRAAAGATHRPASKSPFSGSGHTGCWRGEEAGWPAGGLLTNGEVDFRRRYPRAGERISTSQQFEVIFGLSGVEANILWLVNWW